MRAASTVVFLLSAPSDHTLCREDKVAGHVPAGASGSASQWSVMFAGHCNSVSAMNGFPIGAGGSVSCASAGRVVHCGPGTDAERRAVPRSGHGPVLSAI
jgi:hypothetical protein